MKVAFILPSLLNRGPVVFTRYLVDALIKLGVNTTVFYIKPRIEVQFNCKCEKLEITNINQLMDYDIIHTTMLKPDFLGYLLKVKLNKRWVVSIHNEIGVDLRYNYGTISHFLLEKVWRLALRSAPNIIVSSDEQYNYCKSYIENEKTNYSVIGYGITPKSPQQLDENQYEPFKKLKKDYKIIGTCGLLIKRKGFEQLIELLALRSDIAVIIIGDGECRDELLKKAATLGVKNRFHILGFKHNHLDYYKIFDIYASTSFSEGFGLAMIEAMSMGLPIVCSNLPIYKQHFNESQVCLFNPGNIYELKTAINKAIENKELYSKKSTELFHEKFSAEIMAKKHIAYYQNIVNR